MAARKARKKFKFDFDSFVPFYDRILDNGLASELADDRKGQVCIEAAVCLLTEGKLADNPKCVTPLVATVKIALNDGGEWRNAKARGEGLPVV